MSNKPKYKIGAIVHPNHRLDLEDTIKEVIIGSWSYKVAYFLDIANTWYYEEDIILCNGNCSPLCTPREPFKGELNFEV